MYTLHPCNMSTMIFWLNPGKNVKNAWLDTCFSNKNTALLMNCSTWRRLFIKMYISVLVWGQSLLGCKFALACRASRAAYAIWSRGSCSGVTWEGDQGAVPLHMTQSQGPAGSRISRRFLNTATTAAKVNSPVPLSGLLILSKDWPWSGKLSGGLGTKKSNVAVNSPKALHQGH